MRLYFRCIVSEIGHQLGFFVFIPDMALYLLCSVYNLICLNKESVNYFTMHYTLQLIKISHIGITLQNIPCQYVFFYYYLSLPSFYFFPILSQQAFSLKLSALGRVYFALATLQSATPAQVI